ncbi:epidermal growth factor receptor kinase substrate 8-like protein 3b [Thalassophryne amazonica]|uniref:epidermal growth factor receptor kinase substrate 8-like protein 3b n=1 Tax=Thalassophryne amazonica TaxID=390379 RepID=UPI00147117EA|nr:epidermal growth factor receptor kinase substrate 8-like protein 3b [Thalassophryne amazonica]
MFGNPGPFSNSSRGFVVDDFQQRRGFQQDDLRCPLQRSMSRPSGKSIYMQRKEYSEVLNRQPDNFQFRVEHLFTCELDGQEVKNLGNCVDKLKRLNDRSRLWPQEMIMEVQAGYLLLSDIETKLELESLPLSDILQTTAVLDSCTYNSLLMISVQDRSRRFPQVFIFQCEETGAENIRRDLDKVVQNRDGNVELRSDQADIRSDLEDIIGRQAFGSFRQTGPRDTERERTLPPPPPPDHPAPQWNYRDPENVPRMPPPHEETIPRPSFIMPQHSLDFPQAPDNANVNRNMDILNHIITDMEIFVAMVMAAANTPPAQQEKKKKKKSKKKSKNTAPEVNLPHWEEYVSCLQKMKYGFNLLAHLANDLTNPSAPELVHNFFYCLGLIVPQYPPDLPPTVISPLLTDAALRLLSQEVGPEEDQLWRSLGDSWNIPRSKWPYGDVPPFIPEFYDGWQPPPPPAPNLNQNGPLSRTNSMRFPLDQPNEQVSDNHCRHRRHLRSTLEICAGLTFIFFTPQWGTGRQITLDMNSTPAEVKAWLEDKGFAKITVSSLSVLNGKLLLGLSKEELRTVCPEEGGKVFFQLQGVKSSIALASESSGMYNSRY